MMVELLLAAILAIGSFLGLGHNGVGKGHYEHGQGNGYGHEKHGDKHCCVSCPTYCDCDLPCEPPCDLSGGGGI